MAQLLCILIALFAGYFCKKISVTSIMMNRFLRFSVLLILVIMGYEFGSSSAHIFNELLQLFEIVVVFTTTLFLFNFITVYVYMRLKHISYQNLLNHSKSYILFSKYIFESGKYLLYLLIGITAGALFNWKLVYINDIINVILLIILFIIGYQLRAQNVSIKQIFSNKIGIAIAALILISSMAAGVVAAKWLHLDIHTGLVLSSGFGWYTLSGILSGQLINHQIGTASFFIDFTREIVAIILIPILGRQTPLPMIGYSGATALDFTLPIIKVNLGDEVVPIAVTSGMILTILVPILLPLMWTV